MAKNNKKTKQVVINKREGDFEYKMSVEMADALLKLRKGEEKKKHPSEYLCEIVDAEFGIKGVCSRVIVE